MATLIIKDRHSGKLALPHYLLINDQIVGVMKGEARVTVPAAKLELAKRLHYDHNASANQLQRLISVDADLLAAIL
ncbi:MAG: hypothetical protein ACI3Y9_05200 [Candidatus Cryptobacteroides sp.]